MRVVVFVCCLAIIGCHHRGASDPPLRSMAEVYAQLDQKCSQDLAALQQLAARGAAKVEQLHHMEMSVALFAIVLNNYLPAGSPRDCAADADSLVYQITRSPMGSSAARSK
jgi:hypothetical protein